MSRFRFVFLPDIHLRRDEGSPDGFARALQAVEALDPAPDFIVTGGDLIHDSRSLNKDQATEMAEYFQRICAENTGLRGGHVLGNHDVAGFRNDDFPEDDPQYGLALLRQALGMTGIYYSFDHKDCHFVVLNNFRVTDEGGFVAEFDNEQMAFLCDDLAVAGDWPTLIFGHYPAVTAIEFFEGEAERGDGAWRLGYGRAARNPMALVEAIGEANVRGIFSGHIHRLDRIEAKGQMFICPGSVSGDQWEGPDVDTPPSITLVDCYEDGTVACECREYG